MLWKVLNPNRECIYGRGSWLPPGEWMPEIKGTIRPYENGYHVVPSEKLVIWIGPCIHAVEVSGDTTDDYDKIVVRRARLLGDSMPTWTPIVVANFAVDCAARVMHMHPDLPTIINQIRSSLLLHETSDVAYAADSADAAAGAAADAARAAAAGAAAAGAAAADAARAAAWAARAAAVVAADAAGAAARAAAGATGAAAGAAAGSAWAAGAVADAARAAAWAAAGDARAARSAKKSEQEWQTRRLFAYLDGRINP